MYNVVLVSFVQHSESAISDEAVTCSEMNMPHFLGLSLTAQVAYFLPFQDCIKITKHC